MTIIVGLIDQDGRVRLGADTVYSNGNRHVDRNSKITSLPVKRPYLKNQEIAKENTYILIGTSGGVRPAQVVRAMRAPDWPKGQSAYQYLIGPFVSAMRDALASAGQMGKSDTQIDEAEVTMLVGIDGRLFIVWQDFSVTQPDDDYAAIGSGTDLALGALFAVGGDADPVKRILVALRAAAAYSASCGGKLDIKDELGNVCRVE